MPRAPRSGESKSGNSGRRRSPKVNQGEEAFAYWCRALKLPTPTRNFRFHPTRKFEIDWCWPQYKIGVEIQGGIFVGGAHSRPMNIMRDMTKHNLLLDLGWRVWHYTPRECIDGVAIQHIDKVLRSSDTTLSVSRALAADPVIPPSHDFAMQQTEEALCF